MKKANYNSIVFIFLAGWLMISCGLRETDGKEKLAGNWIILYPDHRLTSMHQREVYGRHQDSLISLYGLKLITLASDGSFWEADSLYSPAGKWLFTPDSLLKIREAGKGFNPFNTSFAGLQNDELLLTQYLLLEDEKIRLEWHLKKIANDNEAARLFSKDNNAWRKKPAVSQTKAALQSRLAALLSYYGDYFALVGEEASYFSPERVPLPFYYYQHAIGLKTAMLPAFTQLFYDEAQAMEAYRLLERGMAVLKSRFPRGENFVQEYGLSLKELAAWLTDEKNAE